MYMDIVCFILYSIYSNNVTHSIKFLIVPITTAIKSHLYILITRQHMRNKCTLVSHGVKSVCFVHDL